MADTLFKGFTTNGVQNYNQKFFGMLDSISRWRCRSMARNLPQGEEIPCNTAVKPAGLLLAIILYNFYSKTFK